ncbi:MAG TPA: DMT family transporter [Chitinophagaceae bacterium]|nr:DMT family transporter [Chitinophagaceae bacterium]
MLQEQNRSTRWNAHVAVLLTNIFFGANFSAVQYIAQRGVPAFGLNVIRVGVSSILFWLLILFVQQRKWIKREHIPRFLLCAITGVVINQLLFIKGLTLTLSIHASLLILITPIFITTIAAWIGSEALNIFKITGLILGICGAIILVLQKESSGQGSNIMLGNILVILNAISYAFYFVLVKPLMKEYHSFEVIRWLFTLGFCFMLPIGWSEFSSIPWELLSAKDYVILSSIVFFATFLAYLFNLYGISKLGASITGAYIYTQPIFAAIIAVFVMNEQLTIQKLIAAALIVSGVLMVNKRSSVN